MNFEQGPCQSTDWRVHPFEYTWDQAGYGIAADCIGAAE